MSDRDSDDKQTPLDKHGPRARAALAKLLAVILQQKFSGEGKIEFLIKQGGLLEVYTSIREREN